MRLVSARTLYEVLQMQEHIEMFSAQSFYDEAESKGASISTVEANRLAVAAANEYIKKLSWKIENRSVSGNGGFLTITVWSRNAVI